MLERKTVSQCISYDYCLGWNDAVDAMPRWIPVEERLPEKGETVLVAFTDGYVTIGTPWRDCWVIPYSDFEDPVSKGTWWMPLPEPPEVTKP